MFRIIGSRLYTIKYRESRYLTNYRECRYNLAMKIHLPNSAFLGNIDSFLRGFDPTSPDTLEITSNQNWISIHPVVLSMVTALGLTVKPGQIHFQKPEAR